MGMVTYYKTYRKREELEQFRRDTTNALAHDLKTPLSINYFTSAMGPKTQGKVSYSGLSYPEFADQIPEKIRDRKCKSNMRRQLSLF